MWLYRYALLAVEDLPCLSAKCHSKFGVDKLHSYVADQIWVNRFLGFSLRSEEIIIYWSEDFFFGYYLTQEIKLQSLKKLRNWGKVINFTLQQIQL